MVAMVVMIVVGVVDVAIVAVRAACIVVLVARYGKRYRVEHKSGANISGSCTFCLCGTECFRHVSDQVSWL